MGFVMKALEKVEQSAVLMKAFNTACVALGISNSEKGQILGVNGSTLSRNSIKGFAPSSKTGELQLH